jgi:glutamate 5-kinase
LKLIRRTIVTFVFLAASALASPAAAETCPSGTCPQAASRTRIETAEQSVLNRPAHGSIVAFFAVPAGLLIFGSSLIVIATRRRALGTEQALLAVGQDPQAWTDEWRQATVR